MSTRTASLLLVALATSSGCGGGDPLGPFDHDLLRVSVSGILVDPDAGSTVRLQMVGYEAGCPTALLPETHLNPIVEAPVSLTGEFSGELLIRWDPELRRLEGVCILASASDRFDSFGPYPLGRGDPVLSLDIVLGR